MKTCGKRETVAIVVPLYRDWISPLEEVSLKQLKKNLGNYDIYFAVPDNLTISVNKIDAGLVKFHSSYFTSVQAYNRLMLSTDFYYAFINYEYILIYQLDALVFKDDLKTFCEMGYDYIGAPWISGYFDYACLGRKILRVGNGGLSLRKVESCISVLKKDKAYSKYADKNEDAFFSSCDGAEFKVAPVNVALTFAFEREVRQCYAENHYRIPFGCHAWQRYDSDFWYNILKEYGEDVGSLLLDCRNEDLENIQEYKWLSGNSRLLESDIYLKELENKILDTIRKKNDHGFILFGAGYFGASVGRLFKDLQIPLMCYVDSDENKIGSVLSGVRINSLEMLDSESKIIVTVMPRYYPEIEKKLHDMNYRRYEDYILWEDILPKES